MDPATLAVIAQFGFPALVAFFLLVRFEAAIKNLTKAVYKMSEESRSTMQQLGEIIRHCQGVPPGPIHLHKRTTDTENGDTK